MRLAQQLSVALGINNPFGVYPDKIYFDPHNNHNKLYCIQMRAWLISACWP